MTQDYPILKQFDSIYLLEPECKATAFHTSIHIVLLPHQALRNIGVL